METVKKRLIFVVIFCGCFLLLVLHGFTSYIQEDIHTKGTLFKLHETLNGVLQEYVSSDISKENVAGIIGNKSLGAKKIILGWQEMGQELSEDKVFQHLKCKVRNCRITYDHNQFSRSDAVIFRIALGFPKPPPRRPFPSQRWVFWQHESASHASVNTVKRADLTNVFNWTMTYRLDSDFPIPFGRDLTVLSGPRITKPHDLLASVKAKTKGVAWLVSNCHTHSKREQYVKELQKYIPVDVYGRCGPKKTPLIWKNKDTDTLKMINDTYLFYLSFENSLCKDYATEKFFKVLPYDLVPVVRSGADYDKLVPHKWYINTKDYSSPKDLAQYLHHLQSHPEEVVKYLDRRKDFNYDMATWSEQSAFCDLCEKLNNPNDLSKIYDDIYKWWSQDICHPVTDIPGQ